MKVLICEDNTLIALDLEDLVRESGHTPIGITARSKECLQLARDLKPDAVLLDLNLADGRTGPIVAAELKSLGIPFVIISGELSFLPDDLQTEHRIEKPISQAELSGALSEIAVGAYRHSR